MFRLVISVCLFECLSITREALIFYGGWGGGLGITSGIFLALFKIYKSGSVSRQSWVPKLSYINLGNPTMPGASHAKFHPD